MTSEQAGESVASDDQFSSKVAHPWWALVALLIGVSMIIIDSSLVNVLLPDMVDDLGLNQTETQWVNTIYVLIFAALLITIGLLADRYGRRLLFLLGVVIFVVGSLASGTAQDPSFLIAARAVQAIGGAMMLPSTAAVINVLFTGPSRALAFGLFGTVLAGAAALGPLLGGFLAEYFSWRWAFLVNIPVGAVAALMALRFVPENKGPKIAGLDPVGVVLSAGGIGLLVYGLIEGQQFGWWTAIAQFDLGPLSIGRGGLSVVPIALVTGCVLLLLLVTWERHQAALGKASLLDLSLFRIRRYGIGNVVALVVSLGEFGVLFALPLWIQAVHGLSPLETGAILASLALGAMLAGGLAGKAASLMGPTRLIRLGLVLEVAGIVVLSFTFGVDRSPWWLVIPLFFYGLGLGFASAQLANVVLVDVPPLKSGQASAVNNTFRQIGTALGTAIIGAVLFTGLGTILNDTLTKEAGISDGDREKIVNEVRGTSGQAIRGLEEIPGLSVIVKDAKESYTEAARDAALVAGGLVFIGLLASFALPRDRKEDYQEQPTMTTDA